MPLTQSQIQHRFSGFQLSAGIFVIALGLIAITGWFYNISTLESVFANYATMKFNTALCLVMAGIAFLLLVKGPSSAFVKIIFLAATISFGLFAFISLSQNVFHWSAGVDQLFVTDFASMRKGLPFPGRMSSSTSLCFSLLSISFLLVSNAYARVKSGVQYLLHTVTLISFIAIIGYVLKVPYTLKFSFFSSMAVNTGLGFFILSVSASTINYQLGLTSLFTGGEIGNIVARRLFPRMAVILIVTGYISIQLQRESYISTEFGVVITTIVFLVIGLLLINDTLTEMNRLDMKRTEAENETLLLNKNLESIVHQRTLALENSNTRFQKILNVNPIGIAISNLETGEYADVNPALTQLLGYTDDEIIGRTSAELSIISPEYRVTMVESISTRGYIRGEDVVLMDKNGVSKHCILSAELLETEQGRYLMSFVYDITNRKLMEDTLYDAKSSLEVLTDKLSNQNKQLLSFAHIISHNLRSPVSNLNLLVHFYKESTTPEDKDDLWGNFETVIGHLNTTLDDLLETLKIQEDTGKERELLYFEQTFNPIKDMLIGQIIESHAVIKTDFTNAAQVNYPKMYLESILLNLISNALKYRSPERPPVIIIKTDIINGETVLTVSDNGLGIDLKRHGKKLFGMRKTFHRHAEAKGLGLFLTKTQIEAMGGEITAESTVDVGSTFKVTFNKK
jgi:PAS domain S-box-containing protein